MNKLLAFVVVFAVFTAIVVLNSNNVEDELAIYFPVGKDFINSDQGKATFEFKFPATEFKVGDETADILMFLESETVSGLRIAYNQKDNRIYAGTPPLITEAVVLLDGQVHKLEYTFNKEQKKQSISLDGILLASGEYTGPVTVLTGYVVSEQLRLVESTIPIKVSFE